VLPIRVAVHVRPEGSGAFVAQLKKEAQELPATFAGCQRFAFHHDPGDPGSFLLYEEWAAVLFPLIDGQPDSAYYESERVGP
jgi:quinol monooxygenase YgiN